MRLIAAMLCVAVAASAIFAQEGKKKPLSDPRSNTIPAVKPVPPVVQAGNAFALDIYKKLALTQDGLVALKNPPAEGNIFLSPASIHTALAMTYAGAAGETAKEMEKTLHFAAFEEGYQKEWKDKMFPAFGELMKELNNPPKYGDKPPYQLVMANALWGQKNFKFKDSYLALVGKDFQASFEALDFAKTEEARKTINGWVEKQTKEKIKNLIPQGVLDESTRLVLTNAIYFKSDWSHKFEKEATKDEEWRTKDLAKELRQVPMMHQQHTFPYMENETLQALSLPYMGDALSMVIILPRSAEGLAALEKDLSIKQLDKIVTGLAPAEVNVTMPKFTFSSEFSLKKVLSDLGMTDAFDGGKANFSGMADVSKDRNLYISAVLHKAFVAVDENGTEAAAATAVAIALAAAPVPQQPKQFKADHPFMFLIRHNETGEILFLGRVTEPRTK